jgi:hypothetical protein
MTSASAAAMHWALMAEYADADGLLAAARQARAAGFSRIEAYAPFPIEGLAEAIGYTKSGVASWTFVGGLLGGVAAYALQWYSATIDYAIDVGGRPTHSWPMFVPVTFEMTILGAALAAVVALFVGNGLPNLHHPIFDAPDFDLAMRNRFFLALRCDDPAFAHDAADRLLEASAPLRRFEVTR